MPRVSDVFWIGRMEPTSAIFQMMCSLIETLCLATRLGKSVIISHGDTGSTIAFISREPTGVVDRGSWVFVSDDPAWTVVVSVIYMAWRAAGYSVMES